MRIRRFVQLFVFMVAAGGALAASAQAQDFAADFTTDDEGFEIVEFDPNGVEESIESTPDYSPTNGNPGGFIRFTDSDSGNDEFYAFFVTGAPVVAGQIGRTVSFDLKSNAATNVQPVVVSLQTSGGGIYCDFGAPQSGWTSYSALISPDNPCWKNLNSTDATQATFNAVFGGTGNWLVGADHASSAGELTDLDNFVIAPSPIARQITIRYKKRAKAFSGLLSQDTGPSGDACVQSVEVQLYQVAGGPDKLLDSDLTDAGTGKWKVARKARRDKKYYALAPELSDPLCAEAQSKSIKPL